MHLQVIHMDLKSKNILLNRDKTVAKITDVGLSRGMATSNRGFTPGTLEYSAPEILLGLTFHNTVLVCGCIQLIACGALLCCCFITHLLLAAQVGGEQAMTIPHMCPSATYRCVYQLVQNKVPSWYAGRFCSGKADIFSYGVILWEIVTHEQPTRGGLRDCRCPQECPAEIDCLINQCLYEDADQRPSAKEVYEVLRLWKVGESAVREARKSQETLSKHTTV